MGPGKVLTRGQVTVPQKIREALGIRPRDFLSFRIIGEGRAEISVVHRMRLEDALRRYRITDPVDDRTNRPAWQEEAARDAGAAGDG